MKPAKIMLPLIILVQFALNTVVGAAWVTPGSDQVIPAGVSISGVDVGGFTRDKAVAYLKQKRPRAAIEQKVTLIDGSRIWTFDASDCGYRYDYFKTVDSILDKTRGRNSSRLLQALRLQARGADYPWEISYDTDKLNNFLNFINDQIKINATDAHLVHTATGFSVADACQGRELDYEQTSDRIKQSLLSGSNAPIEIGVKVIYPRVKKEDLSQVNSKLSTFTTSLAGSPANRSKNVLLASSALDKSVILPGEIWSFNQQVGPRTKERGYLKAPIITGSNLKDEIGGGVCQVASTLYNAARQSKLMIVEHSNHSLPVKYVPPGLDATVYYNLLDLKIKNNQAHPVVIHSYLANNALFIEIWGCSQDNQAA